MFQWHKNAKSSSFRSFHYEKSRDRFFGKKLLTLRPAGGGLFGQSSNTVIFKGNRIINRSKVFPGSCLKQYGVSYQGRQGQKLPR